MVTSMNTEEMYDKDDIFRRQSPERTGKPSDGYFQYINVPGPNEYEFGWNRGDIADQ